jgi:ankyrin repeat protein
MHALRRLQAGADAALQDADGETALHKACAQVGARLLPIPLVASRALLRHRTTHCSATAEHLAYCW